MDCSVVAECTPFLNGTHYYTQSCPDAFTLDFPPQFNVAITSEYITCNETLQAVGGKFMPIFQKRDLEVYFSLAITINNTIQVFLTTALTLILTMPTLLLRFC
jgi:hypothetical protein